MFTCGIFHYIPRPTIFSTWAFGRVLGERFGVFSQEKSLSGHSPYSPANLDILQEIAIVFYDPWGHRKDSEA